MPSKFIDIQIGDTVLTRETVRLGTKKATFLTPKKVVSKTKNYFTLEDSKTYSKSNGRQKGVSFSYAYKEGESLPYRGKKAKDESQSMNNLLNAQKALPPNPWKK